MPASKPAHVRDHPPGQRPGGVTSKRGPQGRLAGASGASPANEPWEAKLVSRCSCCCRYAVQQGGGRELASAAGQSALRGGFSPTELQASREELPARGTARPPGRIARSAVPNWRPQRKRTCWTASEEAAKAAERPRPTARAGREEARATATCSCGAAEGSTADGLARAGCRCRDLWRSGKRESRPRAKALERERAPKPGPAPRGLWASVRRTADVGESYGEPR